LGAVPDGISLRGSVNLSCGATGTTEVNMFDVSFSNMTTNT
jgi:hypothetical protein